MSILTTAHIFDAVRLDLAKVEVELSRLLRQSNIPVVEKFSSHILGTSGKRLRPALLLLSTKSFNVPTETAIRYACVFELIHTATLVHDDVIDHSFMRRGRRTLNAVWGDTLTVLFGDLLYLQAMSSAIEGRNWQMMELLSTVTSKVIEGELLQHDQLYKIDISRDQYFDILERKTALLFSACCQSGAILSGASSKIVQDFADYGLHLGRAFQLVDDLLDYSSTETELGKPVFTDLREGKLTLPILILKDLNPQKTQSLIDIFWANDQPNTEIEKASSNLKTLIAEHQVLEKTYHVAKQETERALAILSTSSFANDSFDFFRLLPNLLLDRLK